MCRRCVHCSVLPKGIQTTLNVQFDVHFTSTRIHVAAICLLTALHTQDHWAVRIPHSPLFSPSISSLSRRVYRGSFLLNCADRCALVSSVFVDSDLLCNAPKAHSTKIHKPLVLPICSERFNKLNPRTDLAIQTLPNLKQHVCVYVLRRGLIQ